MASFNRQFTCKIYETATVTINILRWFIVYQPILHVERNINHTAKTLPSSCQQTHFREQLIKTFFSCVEFGDGGSRTLSTAELSDGESSRRKHRWHSSCGRLPSCRLT